MGDQKDHMLIQKKETESSVIESETANFEATAESLPPPALQLKAETKSTNGEKKEEGAGAEKEENGAFQFALSGPPSKPDNTNSKTLDASVVQGKGIATPFRMPIVQKKEASAAQTPIFKKPSFKL
jgi:hypothetical protein